MLFLIFSLGIPLEIEVVYFFPLPKHLNTRGTIDYHEKRKDTTKRGSKKDLLCLLP